MDNPVIMTLAAYGLTIVISAFVVVIIKSIYTVLKFGKKN